MRERVIGDFTIESAHRKNGKKWNEGMYKKYIKRLLDIIFSFLFLLVLSPLFLLIMLLICLDSKGGPFFLQKRIGRNEKVFMIYKFRSMTVNAEHTGSGVYSNDHDPRVTRMGRILRKHSLDELPQFINVLKGDMSFIGPRPPLTYHPWPLSEYTPRQKKMFAVRPGITGWAQVNGRRSIDWNERIRLNIWYIDHLTFATDCRIVWRTVKAVLANDNNANTGITVPPSPAD